MRNVAGLVVLFLAACTPGEPQTYTTSADVDLDTVPAMLTAIEDIVDNELPMEELLALTNSVPMDEEKQQRIPVSFRGQDTEMLYHVWREQEGWVHVYASSTSRDLVDAVEAGIRQFERPDGE